MFSAPWGEPLSDTKVWNNGVGFEFARLAWDVLPTMTFVDPHGDTQTSTAVL